MITFSKLGKHGRLANQLFQIASTIGIGNRIQQTIRFPKWNYSPYFENELAFANLNDINSTSVKESFFHYDDNIHRQCSDINSVYDFIGYFQSEKYFDKIRNHIKQQFTFRKDLINQLRRKHYAAFNKKTIAIHIRRGDYIGNSNYANLPIIYYLSALFERFPKWQTDYNLIIFSDDIPYCKVHFDCLTNVFFADGNEIEDLALATECDHFILSNSSYSWWCAWLGEKKDSKIIYPAHHFEGELEKTCDVKDFWPERWTKHDHKPNGVQKVIDLSDVTFTIPVSYDHADRKQNLDLCVCMLKHYFSTNIIIAEQGSNRFEYMKEHCVYMQFVAMRYFHRTKMLNDMARYAETPIVANWDADVIVSPLQLFLTVDKIRKGADCCYPYEWVFARIPRKPWFKMLEKQIDIGIVGDTKFNGMNNNDAVSVGGAVLFNRSRFFEGGAENENFVSFGPEDAERWFRFNALGYKVERTLGPIYHINHFVGPNSSNRHVHVQQNRSEWNKIQGFTKDTLINYIKTWVWTSNK
jgi:hypothetical protein